MQELREEQTSLRGVDLLDANVVLVLAQPATAAGRLAALINDGQLQGLLNPPVTVSQGLAIDPARGGATQSVVIESMRSQKSVTLNAQRLEVHDLSGRQDLRDSGLGELLLRLAPSIGAEQVSALGFNYELTLDLGLQVTAARSIADRLLAHTGQLAPPGFDFRGGGVRLFLRRDNVTYTISVEPRFNDPNSSTLWIASNSHIEIESIPKADEITAGLQDGFDVVRHVAQTAFGDADGEDR